MDLLADSRARVVYVCHPYRADPRRHAEEVRRICRGLAASRCLPLGPQIYLPRFVNDCTERDLAMRLCLGLLALADEVRVFGDPTEGMRLEIAEARRLGIPVVDGDRGAAIPDNGDPPR